MNIIKEGRKDIADARRKQTKRFECLCCGCIFEADKGEYDHTYFRNEDQYSCKCPTCESVVHLF